MNKPPIYALLLAGGASSRLFPFNKILSDLTGAGKTLVQQAYARARTLATAEDIYVLAVADLQRPIAQQLALARQQFFVDPARRGTWPALLWAMAHLRLQDPQAVLSVLTSDQIIPRLKPFAKAAKRACQLAAKSPSIVMLGVPPGTNAQEWTGYGVFQVKGEQVTRFSEKPSLAQAEAMINARNWQWNSGMFFFRISTAERALAKFQPAMASLYADLCSAVERRQMTRAQKIYAKFPSQLDHPSDPERKVDNTIDFAIMTPLVSQLASTGLAALAVTGGLPSWMDLGQWDALSSIVKPTKADNFCVGTVDAKDNVRDCILAADRGFRLKIQHLSDLVVAVSDRGILVLKRSQLADIKTHVANAPAARFRIVNSLPEVRIVRSGRKVVVSGAPFIR